ncbi:Gfo/Idh/MocA family protein [Tautonia sociabilis]|uniref:Gfo/Idh/MocA family oxidoreductase n=1 Tax=Tautonia sociabilis TaxID=2080755 RepID=A0A432MHN3_9BACT|nr:Gfo/Idh/MocA family oxidoreductase [Tautonia sociabilis]RUL86438.1 Gfo/Idh/MocA family oxidoreductase [Tautonia sociabilis]
MFQPPYRAAVIGRTGRGNYGHDLDRAFAEEPKFTLVAVADEDEAGRAAASSRLGVDRSYADYREMLERERPEFVAVGPRWLDCHREMVVSCAEFGVRGILLEKPMAPSPADCDAMLSACDASHVKLAIAFQTRVSPIFEQVKTLVADGVIGPVLELRGRGKEDRRGGGEDLMVLGTHIMDLFRAVLGDPSWCFARVTDGGVPITSEHVRDGAEGIGPLAGDRVDAMYGFADSPAVAHFATARPTEPGSRFGLRIFGERGVILTGTGWLPEAYLLRDPRWFDSPGGAGWEPITSAGVGLAEPLPSGGLLDGNRRIVADLIAAVEEDRPPVVSGADGRASIEMILATYASQVAGGPVALPLADRSHPLERLKGASRG